MIVFAWMVLATMISAKTLNLGSQQTLDLLLLNFPIALTITTVTLGIGALKPNFWEKNPEKLSTSPGGILATFLCLTYITLIGSFLLFSNQLPSQNIFILLISWMISGLIALPILLVVPRKIRHYEI